MLSLVRVFLIVCLATALSATAGACRSAPVDTNPVERALCLPDGSDIMLDCVYITMAEGQYAFVRDMWSGGQLLPVYVNAALCPGWTVEIQGRMARVDGARILIATQVRLFVTSDGRPAPPLPSDLLLHSWSAALSDIPLYNDTVSTRLQSTLQTVLQPASIPPPPSAAVTPAVSQALSAPAGSIAAIKINGGLAELQGKIVTAVFRNSAAQAVEYFYVQEEGAPSGIKVVPETSVPVEAGDLVDIKGTLVASDSAVAECYIDAAVVKCVGSAQIPNALGLNNRSAAGGAFAAQQALYKSSTDVGCGLNPVGSRVRLWGKVTAFDGDKICWIDDGSGLTSTVGAAQNTGVRLIFEGSQSFALNQFVGGVTGILGAEMSDESPGRPVPVLRIPATALVGSIIHVKTTGDDDNDGLSWENAVATVTKALTLADAGDEIWVAEGTYHERIALVDGVALFGGFVGDETSRSARNWTSHVTTLDGEEGGSVVTINNCASPATRIDGFTIENGIGTAIEKLYYGNPYTVMRGGGIYCLCSNVVISNNTIFNNIANAGGEDAGGGIYCEDSEPLIWGNTIGKQDCPNSSTNGSAIYLQKCTGQTKVVANRICCNQGDPALCCNVSSVAIIGNTIADHYGTGIWAGDDSTTGSMQKLTVSDNTIENNQGEGIATVHLDAVINRNTITRNAHGMRITDSNSSICNNTIANNYGDGIWCEEGSPVIQGNTIEYNGDSGIFCRSASITVTHNKIIGNSAFCEGGGLWCLNSKFTNFSAIVEANEFRDNDGADHGGAIALEYVGSVRIVNNLFVRNHANGANRFGGGAIQSLGSPSAIINNTFVENWVGTGTWQDMSPAAYGGAILCRELQATTVVNNIFYDNRAQLGGSVACISNARADVSYCDAWPGVSADNYATYSGGMCNLGATLTYLDPLFSNIGSANYWLDANSLLRQAPNHGQNKADNDDVPEFDISGHERPGDLYTDMGAYESDPGYYP